jgi:hypothetical protein
MLMAIARFDLRQHFRAISTYIYFLLLGAIGFLLMVTAAGAFQSAAVAMGGGKVLRLGGIHFFAELFRNAGDFGDYREGGVSGFRLPDALVFLYCADQQDGLSGWAISGGDGYFGGDFFEHRDRAGAGDCDAVY